jgi:acyl-CoA dehydrogenase
MDGWELETVRKTARSFAERAIAPLLAAETRDGELSRVEAVLDEAEAVGLLATADPASPGHDWGVWGRAWADEPPSGALAILEEIAAACAGAAACVHAAGLGAFELAGAGGRVRRAAVALLEQPLHPEPVDLPGPSAVLAPLETRLAAGAGGLLCSGRKAFVCAAPATDAYVVYAQEGAEALRILVPATARGLVVEDAGPRLGLAACRLEHLQLREVPVAEAQRLEPREPDELLVRLWLGLAAIAAGNARGALDEAVRYAQDRYQGGGPIVRHAAVRLLLGESEARIAAARAWILAAAAEPAGLGSLRAAAMLKACVTRDCARAVSDCLQVFGGYGYMEDQRMEKRLRDALAIAAMAGRPDGLLAFVGATAVQMR